jgi:hypothetical protein
VTVDLETMLKSAANGDNWTHVVHRCAWCSRVMDEHGNYINVVPVGDATVATDGMCAACATRALAQIAERSRAA